MNNSNMQLCISYACTCTCNLVIYANASPSNVIVTPICQKTSAKTPLCINVSLHVD